MSDQPVSIEAIKADLQAAHVKEVLAQPIEGETPSEVTVAPSETITEEIKEETPPATSFAALKSKEKAIQKREQSLKEAEAKVIAFESNKEQWKKDPAALLEAVGLSVDDFVDSFLNKKADSPTKELETRLETLEREKKEAETKLQAKAEQEQIDGYTNELSEWLASTDEYPLVKETNSASRIFEYQMSEYQRQIKEGITEPVLPTKEEVTARLEKVIEEVLDEQEKQAKMILDKKRAKKTEEPTIKATAITKPAISTLRNSTINSNTSTVSVPEKTTEQRLEEARRWVMQQGQQTN